MSAYREASFYQYILKNRLHPGNCANILVSFSCCDGNIHGTLWSARSVKSCDFQNFTQLMLALKAAAKEIKTPVPDDFLTEMPTRKTVNRGHVCSALIQIRGCQHASIQGHVQICGSSKKLCFRSEQELVRLLCTALDACIKERAENAENTEHMSS